MKNILFALVFVFSVMQLSAALLALHPDNPHYFIYNGEPAVLMTSAEHYGAVLNMDFDYEFYLNTLHQDAVVFTGAGGEWIKLNVPEGDYYYEFISPFTGDVLKSGTMQPGSQTRLILPGFEQLLALKIIG